MTPQHSSRIGTCPHCNSEITEFHVLIEYQTSNGDESVWAECPSCQEVIKPE